MTKALKITLIAAASTVGAGVISAVSYVKGKSDGIALANKTNAQLGANADAPRGNTRTSAAAAS